VKLKKVINIMKITVIHPTDSTTDFLDPIYSNLNQAKIINGKLNQRQICESLKKSTRVIMLGHGTPDGLLSVGQFKDDSLYVIGSKHTDILKDKINNIYIWCHANKYVEKNNLKGFYTGMFLSDWSETIAYGVWDATLEDIEISNRLFAEAVSKNIDLDAHDLLTEVVKSYSKIKNSNQVVDFNIKLLGAR
jgi:hypothetical protein